MNATLREIIKRVPRHHRTVLEHYAQKIRRYSEPGLAGSQKSERAQLAGYVECLTDVGILTSSEGAVLYLHYAVPEGTELAEDGDGREEARF